MNSPTPDGLRLKTFKYKLYPTQNQQQLMHETTFLCSLVYNQCLAQRKKSWEKERQSISCYDQIKQLPALKEKVELLFWARNFVRNNPLSPAFGRWQSFLIDIKLKGCYNEVKNPNQRRYYYGTMDIHS